MADTSALHHAQEIAVTNRDTTLGGLFEHIKQHDHHKADHEKKTDVFIRGIQFIINFHEVS